MTTYDLTTKWLRESNQEYNHAMADENYLKMKQIERIIEALRDLRSKLS